MVPQLEERRGRNYREDNMLIIRQTEIETDAVSIHMKAEGSKQRYELGEERKLG